MWLFSALQDPHRCWCQEVPVTAKGLHFEYETNSIFVYDTMVAARPPEMSAWPVVGPVVFSVLLGISGSDERVKVEECLDVVARRETDVA